MSDLAGWLQTRLGSGPPTNLPAPADGALGSILAALASKRARHSLLNVRNVTGRCIDDDNAQLRDSELGSAGPSLPLIQARLEIEALTVASRRKDEFLAMLSHELRSPLASLSCGMRFLGTRQVEIPAQRRMQALIERQLKRMTRLVDELLDVSRITSGRMHLQRERVDLRVIVGHALETLEANFSERNHQVSTELSGAPVWLQADALRLEQVFVNLLANASRYTDAGGRVSVWVHAREGQAIVRVRDSGIGIAAEALPHIFDLFKQANATDPRSKDGLGIGLAVVRTLVELHGGSVNVASAGTGQGSEFTVRLPTQA